MLFVIDTVSPCTNCNCLKALQIIGEPHRIKQLGRLGDDKKTYPIFKTYPPQKKKKSDERKKLSDDGKIDNYVKMKEQVELKEML